MRLRTGRMFEEVSTVLEVGDSVKKKIEAIFFIIIGCVVVVYLVASIWGLVASGFAADVFNPRINHRRMERIFTNDYELLSTVVDYFLESGHTEIRISTNTEKGFISVGGDRVAINDETVVDVIYVLQNRRYSVILMYGNTIRFQRWANLNSGRGIAFSIDGAEPSAAIITRTEPLSKSNWYYYWSGAN